MSGCICGGRFPMCEDGHAVNCPASNQHTAYQRMTAARAAAEGAELTEAEFLRDLAGRLFRTATPAMGFDQGDTDRLHRIARDLTTPPARSYADGLAVAAKHLDERAERARVAAIGGGMDPLDAELLDYEYSNAAAAIRLLSQGEKA